MARFEFEEGVKMIVDRVPGTRNDECSVNATSSTAAIKGLCWLVEEVASELGMTKEEVLCRMTVVLMAPPQKADVAEGSGTADHQMRQTNGIRY